MPVESWRAGLALWPSSLSQEKRREVGLNPSISRVGASHFFHRIVILQQVAIKELRMLRDPLFKCMFLCPARLQSSRNEPRPSNSSGVTELLRGARVVGHFLDAREKPRFRLCRTVPSNIQPSQPNVIRMPKCSGSQRALLKRGDELLILQRAETHVNFHAQPPFPKTRPQKKKARSKDRATPLIYHNLLLGSEPAPSAISRAVSVARRLNRFCFLTNSFAFFRFLGYKFLGKAGMGAFDVGALRGSG